MRNTAKDCEFSGTSMRDHWQSGYEDTKRTLRARNGSSYPRENLVFLVNDVHRENQ